MIEPYILDKIKSLSIERVAEDLDLTVKRHKTRCPFHDDTRPSLTFNVAKNKYRCYVCGAKGGPIDLVMHELNLNFIDACKWLGNKNGIYFDDDQKSSRWSKVKPVRKATIDNRPSTIDKQEKPDIPYLTRLMAQPIINEQAAKFLYEERKIRPEVVKQLGISSISYNCPMSSSPKPTYFDGPALLIPYRDINGNLLSVQSRYLGSTPSRGSGTGTPTSTCLEGNTREALGLRACSPEAKAEEPAGKALGGKAESSTCLEGSTLQTPRFRFPKGSSCHIFNLNILKNMPPEDPTFITEGVTDCLAMLSAGFASIAIPSATLLKAEDVALLKNRKLHMYPDADEPGQKLFFDLKALCPQLVYHQLPSGFKDVGQYYSFIHKDDKHYAY